MKLLDKKYSPSNLEDRWYKYWLEKDYFSSQPSDNNYTIVIPPPNVTGKLTMGHVLNNTIQDILIRKARMEGKNACWVPGTDHASIATESKVAKMLQEKVGTFDKGGDIFYQQLSAFHKSVRGSSPDGALYWMARMLVSGCDPKVIARRLLAIASEDIGNADPRALQITLNAWDVYERLGDKEGNRAIAQAAVFCACAPKSNAVYTAFNQAMEDARDSGDLEVPIHLCNASTKLMKDLGYGEGYRYAHDEPGAFSKGQSYFPEKMGEQIYYEPTDRGLEIKIREKLKQLRST